MLKWLVAALALALPGCTSTGTPAMDTYGDRGAYQFSQDMAPPPAPPPPPLPPSRWWIHVGVERPF
jgi:hypothetical protein